MVRYKEKCMFCKKNWVLVTYYKQRPICDSCGEKFMQEPITDPAMKKLFAIDTKFYDESRFLRSIRINYARFGSLSEKQVEAFKKVVADLKSGVKRTVKPKRARKKRETTVEIVGESSIAKRENYS